VHAIRMDIIRFVKSISLLSLTLFFTSNSSPATQATPLRCVERALALINQGLAKEDELESEKYEPQIHLLIMTLDGLVLYRKTHTARNKSQVVQKFFISFDASWHLFSYVTFS
jgi:hypothetical protein